MEESFGTRGSLQVEGTIDGVAVRGRLFKYGFPQHVFGVLKKVRQQISKEPGDTVQVVLRRREE